MPDEATIPGSVPMVKSPVLAMPKPRFQPPIITFMAVPGFGKTTTAAFAPKPAIVMAGDELGYLTLLGAGRVPTVPCVTITTWEQFIAFLDELIIQDKIDFKTLVLDAIGGFERMCHQFVCDRDFGGDWGEGGFKSFQQGYDVAMNDWRLMLNRIERVRARGIMILMLSHTHVRTVKNLTGHDYPGLTGDSHRKSWAQIQRVSDAVLLGKFYAVVEKIQGQHKGLGGKDRVVYTEGCDVFDAKNRYGMKQLIDLSEDPKENWSIIWDQIKPQSRET